MSRRAFIGQKLGPTALTVDSGGCFVPLDTRGKTVLKHL